MEILVKMKFGSHLYGTDTPESDLDIKGVYMPSPDQIMMGEWPDVVSLSTNKSSDKNTAEDVDEEYYSIHKFMKMLMKGEVVALDILHAPNDVIYQSSPLWEELRVNSDLFNTSSMAAFVGYAQKQAAKYGIKGSRLNDAKEVLEWLDDLANCESPEAKIQAFPFFSLDHVEHLEQTSTGINQLKICGLTIQGTMKVNYAADIIRGYISKHGARAKLAAKNEGIDWKAVSHAIRAAMELKEIYTKGKISFPLKEAVFLKKIKAGELDYISVVAPILEEKVEEVKTLAENSDLPEKVDKKAWDKWLILWVWKYLQTVNYNE